MGVLPALSLPRFLAALRGHRGGSRARRGGLLLARVTTDEAEVLTLAVAPEARRQGVARALLAAAMTAGRERDARTMFLEVAVDNAAAQTLYRQAGFVEAGRRRRYYANGGDALILRVRLA